jgi:hypothetical protein
MDLCSSWSNDPVYFLKAQCNTPTAAAKFLTAAAKNIKDGERERRERERERAREREREEARE